MKPTCTYRIAAGLLVGVATLAGLSALGAGCGSARRGLPVGDPINLTDPALINGRQVFMNHCHQCHPGGTAGLSFAINNRPLPGWLMRWQVRNGFGAMPAFPERVISDQELDHLVAYLDYLQTLPPPEFARKRD